MQSARTVDKAQKLAEDGFGNSAISTSLNCLEGGNCPQLSWWGRGDLNPGPPAPQAGILDQTSLTGTRIAPNPDEETRLRPHTTGTRYNEEIINTLLENRAQYLLSVVLVIHR